MNRLLDEMPVYDMDDPMREPPGGTVALNSDHVGQTAQKGNYVGREVLEGDGMLGSVGLGFMSGAADGEKQQQGCQGLRCHLSRRLAPCLAL